MPVCAETRARSSLKPFHAVSVLGRRLRLRLASRSFQTTAETTFGLDHATGVEAIASNPLTVPNGLGAALAGVCGLSGRGAALAGVPLWQG